MSQQTEQNCYAPVNDFLKETLHKQGQASSGQQSRYHPIFSVSLSSDARLSVSWNDLIFWHSIVTETKEGVQGAAEKESDVDPNQDRNRISMARTACLEALMAAKHYSRGTYPLVSTVLTILLALAPEQRLKLLKEIKLFLGFEKETADLIFGQHWEMELGSKGDGLRVTPQSMEQSNSSSLLNDISNL